MYKKLLGFILCWCLLLPAQAVAAQKPLPENAREASYYQQIDALTVQCQLCPHSCLLTEGLRGICRVRESRGGKLYTLAYANPCTYHIDPIEKSQFTTCCLAR